MTIEKKIRGVGTR